MNHFIARDSSRRYLIWTKSVRSTDGEEAVTFKSSCSVHKKRQQPATTPRNKKLSAVVVARLRSILSSLAKKNKPCLSRLSLGRYVIGTLFGHRHGHVRFALQKDSKSLLAFLVELATPVSGLVREMATGLVRIALECKKGKDGRALVEEPLWRGYLNGKKCGFARRKECGMEEWKVLKALEPISMGAGVCPAADGGVMYMRARFERVVGSTDSEAFYMMDPDSNGAPELCVYLLRL